MVSTSQLVMFKYLGYCWSPEPQSYKIQFCPACELTCRKRGEEIFSQGEIDVLEGYAILTQLDTWQINPHILDQPYIWISQVK